jgi:nucleotide-binding universal stress UspA family protein
MEQFRTAGRNRKKAAMSAHNDGVTNSLLYVPTFPDPPAQTFLEGAVALTSLLGSALTAKLPQLDSDPASWRPVMGAFVANYRQVMADIAADSETNAAKADAALGALCRHKNVALDMRRGLVSFTAPGLGLVELARLHDLVIMPAPGPETLDYTLIHAVIFQSGRPVLFLPPARALNRLERVAVAWDFSREAARALKDALPLLRLANEIHVVSVTGEKDIAGAATAHDLEKYLRGHGLEFRFHREEKAFAPVAERLLDHATAIRADLLVMGAYGHSRFSEFVLGGATRGILHAPPLPVLLSH